MDFRWIYFYLPLIFKLPVPEVWRFFTCFWMTGPKLSILFDTVFCSPTLHLYLVPFANGAHSMAVF